MTKNLRILIAQLNFLVGDIAGNYQKMLEAISQAKKNHEADVIVFPELALTGYPPEDLLLRPDFCEKIQKYLLLLAEQSKDIDIIVGYPKHSRTNIFNACAYLHDGKIQAKYYKHLLPNYGVFDEMRYFKPGDKPCVVNIKGIPVGLLICEDLWHEGPAAQSVKHGAKMLICINASPFDMHKLREREKIINSRIQENHVPIVYSHLVGAQDEVIFDGRSMVVNEYGVMTHLAEAFQEDYLLVKAEYNDDKVRIIPGKVAKLLDDEARTYNALVLGVKDYVEKNQFRGVLVGSSGGVDSALTLTIAVDALGSDRVHAVLMPSRFTADISIEDAVTLAKNLNINYSIIPIEHTFEAFLTSLSDEFKNTEMDVTEENIQARCRGVILMALSNKFRKLVLTTGNKSEMAVGYATLYGDMAGGFAVLKDVYKTFVYQLANYRNSIDHVIPNRIITRPPTAELRAEQTDQDTLPAYEILDEILQRYVEQDQDLAEICKAGFVEDMVKQIIMMVDRNEYKRRQAPPGVKVTTRAFGRDRRYPITSGYTAY